VENTKQSFCRICIASCGTLVTVNGDQVVEVRGDPEHPLSHGYLCPKGRALGTQHHHPNRLTGSFVRRAGELVEMTHDDALADAASTIQRVIADHGANSVGMFLGSGGFIDPAATFVHRKLRQQLGTDQNYSTATVDAISKVVVASLMAGTTALVPHLDNASKLVVLVGSNPLVSHGQSTGFPDPVTWVRAARSRGEVYVIDPRHTETAAQATVHLGLRAGTDHALLAHLIRDVVARRSDVAIHNNMRAERFDELVSAVEPYDANFTAQVTGLTDTELSNLCSAIDRAGRIAVVTGTGTSMSVPGNLVEWLAWSLMIVTDSFDKPGGMWFNPGFFTRLDDRPVLPATPPLPTPIGYPSIINVAAEWPASLLPDEIEAGRLRVLIVLGASLTTALPDTERLRRALGKLDALVVLDILDNGNSEFATHRFACLGQLERPDVLAMDLYAPARYSQYTEAVVEPPAGRHPAWRVLAELASRLGLDAIGSGVDPATVNDEEVLARVVRGGSIEALRTSDGGVSVEVEAVYDWAIDRLPNGHWNLAPTVLTEQLSNQFQVDRTNAQETSSDRSGAALSLIPRRQLRRENAHAFRDGEKMELTIHPNDAEPRGLSNGCAVTIRSSIGSLNATAHVTDRITKGTVSLPHGYAENNVNQLISAHDIDSISGMPRLSGTLVEVVRQQVATDPAITSASLTGSQR
jgi:anaerobic selenocysteine-containing dehydrogenase